MMLKYGFEYCGRPLLPDRVCSGDTPLHMSARNGDVGTCDFLLKSGADVNAKDNL
jgi:ankyrin repeat protein